jgi:hypothetical protein
MTIRSGHITRFELIDGREEAAKQLSPNGGLLGFGLTSG